MYKNCESYDYIRCYLLHHIPHRLYLKSREEDDVLLVSNQDGIIFFMNSISKDFLKYCNEHRSINEIVEILLEEYDIDKDTLIDDIIELIREMQIRRIIFFDPME